MSDAAFAHFRRHGLCTMGAKPWIDLHNAGAGQMLIRNAYLSRLTRLRGCRRVRHSESASSAPAAASTTSNVTLTVHRGAAARLASSPGVFPVGPPPGRLR